MRQGVTLRTPLLLLELWVALAPLKYSQGRPSWRFISSEVVIPRKELHHGKGLRTPDWLSYSLSFGGQRHVIHMRSKKLFWTRNLVMMTQDDQGVLQVDYPFVPLDCYYLGYLEETPLSMVTMDTCYGGLNGIMKLDDLTYEIQPLKDSQRFEHVVSQVVADTNATGPTYTLGYKEEKHPLFSQANTSAASRFSTKLYASHAAHVKACLICSHSVYTLHNNVSKCASFLVSIGSMINSLLQGLDVRYYISAVIVYNAQDPTNMRSYAVPGSPFHRHYVTNIYKPLQPHSALIVIRDGPQDAAFTPVHYGLCKENNLNMVGILSRHYFLFSILVTQYIGRNIGLDYDDENCVCSRRATCIMDMYPVFTDAFSNCSMVYMSNVIINKVSSCMFNPEFVYSNKSLTVARCGNAVVDDGERCDCGSLKQCYSDPCCSSDCRLTPGSACDTGGCCTNCTFSPPGTLCRPIANICDLPEYCSGQAFLCPENVHLQDGTPCTEDGYCYRGNCTDLTMHCREIFGPGALKGPDACYRINKEGSRFGQCIASSSSHGISGCTDADIKCGRLQCTNVTHLPRLQEHVAFHQSLIEGSWCFGVDRHIGTYTVDVGHVRPGTPCAAGKFCVKSTCKGSVADINYDCPPLKCNLRGICNSKGNCHCHIGWNPPRCIQTGPGGSIDSGPPPRKMRSVTQSDLTVVYLRVIFGRMYAFIAAFLFGVATNVRTIRTTKLNAVKAKH